MKKSRHASILTVTLMSLAACSGGDDASPSPTEDAGASAPTNRIAVPATVRRNLGITFAGVERRPVESTIRVPGAFELQPLARHEYRMTLPGEVSLRVDQYQHVEAGDLLYRFRSPQWPELQHEIIVGEQSIDSARAEIAVADARIAETERRVVIMRERLEALAAADFKLASLEAELADLEATLPRLRAERQLAGTKLANAQRTREHALHRAASATGIDEIELSQTIEVDGGSVPAYRSIDWIDVRAIESGVVETLMVTEGAFAEATSAVLSTVDPKKVRFRALALQADLARLDDVTEARIVPPATRGIELDDGVASTLTIGLEAHPNERTMNLLATPAEMRDWIRPGVSAFLEVAVESSEGPALAIPRASIVRDGIVHVFFRRDPEDANKVIRVEADMGVSDGRWVVINSGLAPNDEVVLDGAYEMKLASQQSGAGQKGGHFHADGTFHGEH